MQKGKGKAEHGEQWGEEGMVGHAKKEADQRVNGEQGIDDEDQFGQLTDEHGKYLGTIIRLGFYL